MWPAILEMLTAFVLKLLVGLFGTDKPHETEIIETVPEVEIASPSDADLLSDCGL